MFLELAETAVNRQNNRPVIKRNQCGQQRIRGLELHVYAVMKENVKQGSSDVFFF